MSDETSLPADGDRDDPEMGRANSAPDQALEVNGSNFRDQPQTDQAGGTGSSEALPRSVTAPESDTTGRILGMKRGVALAVIGAAVFILLAVIAVIVGSIVVSYNEERDAAQKSYARSVAEHELELERADGTLRDSHAELAATSAEQLLDGTLYVELEDEVAALELKLESDFQLAKFDSDSASNEEILQEAGSIRGMTASVKDESFLVQNALSEFLDSKEAKRLADEEARVAAELAKKKAEAGAVSFEDLFRAGDTVAGTYYRFQGKVIQDAGSGTYRVSITQEPGYSRVFWKDPILVTVSGETSQRILENDIISFVAISMGVQSYESVFGQSIELPLVLADGTDIAVTGRDG